MGRTNTARVEAHRIQIMANTGEVLGEWLYLHVPADMNKWERSLTRKRVGTFAPILGGYVGCVRFGCPTREFTPIDAYEYIDWPCCWHWPVTGAERIPFIPAKGNLRIFKVR